MATAEVSVSDVQFSAGQNEGIERSILPLPQFAAVQNARLRKAGRWGKRYGTAQFATTQDSAGAFLGSGTQNIRTLGSGFVVVDDLCYLFDSVSGHWISPRASVSVGPLLPRVPGAISGWRPAGSSWPMPLPNAIQELTPAAMTLALGYLWIACTYKDPAHLSTPDQIIRVIAINPSDQTLVFQQDIAAAGPGNGGNIQPRLLTCGSVVVLTYITFTGGGNGNLAARSLTSLGSGFGAERALFIAGVRFATHDACATGVNSFAICYPDVVGNNVRVASVNASTLVISTTSPAGPVAGSVIGVSLTSGNGLPVYVTATSLVVSTVHTQVLVYDAGLVGVVGTANIDATSGVASQTSYSALLPGGGVRCSYGYYPDNGATDQNHFSWVDVSSSAVVSPNGAGKQYRFRPCSRPFTIGGEVYQWVTSSDVAVGFGYATLIRLPNIAEYPNAAAGSNIVSCPVEMSCQDFLIRSTNGIVAPSLADFSAGLVMPILLDGVAQYAALLPSLLDTPDTSVPFSSSFRVILATHFTNVPMRLSVRPVNYGGDGLVPGGVLSRVTRQGVTEEGFFSSPSIYSLTPSGLGGTILNGTYQYTYIYVSTDTLGKTEFSAPAPPVSVTLAGGNSQVIVSMLTIAISARPNTRIQVYRTLNNGSIFYLVGSVDGSIQSGPLASFVDGEPDIVIATHEIIYVQVGLELPNAPPPPCNIALAASQRIWLAGLLLTNVVHASKLLLGDQSPAWADSDTHRIVLPEAITGLAWMDNLVVFTATGIYIVSGDGPDDSGQSGQFSAPIRLPFELGCIESRSVITVEQGTFFQTPRGLYMLPRGFGDPVPAGDFVMDTLALFPIITGAAVLTKPLEHTVRWSCCDTINSHGVHLIYDLVHNSWSVDRIGNQNFAPGNNSFPACSITPWFTGELAFAGNQLVNATFSATSSDYDDNGTNIVMQLQTGDVRPFGLTQHGIVSRFMVLAELRSAATLFLTKVSDAGSSTVTRIFSGVAPDYVVGNVAYTECGLGNMELRDLTKLDLTFRESSTLEGLAFIGLAIETAESQGMSKLKPLDRVT